MKVSLFTSMAMVPLATAHFILRYPDPRGVKTDSMPVFPCGSLSQSSQRTQLPLSGGSFPVAIEMHHSATAIEVLLALGDDPGDNFNIVLQPTFGATGLGAFCLPHVLINEKLIGRNLTDGMNATIQVQTNGDPSGGLYACADVQFSSFVSYSKPDSCSNNTGVASTVFSGDAAKRNANESTASGGSQSGSSGSSSGNSSPKNGAVSMQSASWGLIGVAAIGGLAAL